jgi:ribosomal protein S18 acetylase RimI-like enzyme
VEKGESVTQHHILKLAAVQKTQATTSLALAFQHDPAYSYILSDESTRHRYLAALFGAVIGYSLKLGEVYTTAKVQGAACWLPPGRTQVTLWGLIRTGFGLQRAVAQFPADARKGFLEMLSYLEETHKRLMTAPHWYLWALGVHPDHQGRGIGGALLQPVLAQADQEGVPCYLETQTEANVSFYEKRGFRVVQTGNVEGHGVQLWMMARDPV